MAPQVDPLSGKLLDFFKQMENMYFDLIFDICLNIFFEHALFHLEHFLQNKKLPKC